MLVLAGRSCRPAEFLDFEDSRCRLIPATQDYFLFAKNNRSKFVWTLFQRKFLNNQTVWPVKPTIRSGTRVLREITTLVLR
jgi:hypothetical protein